MRKSRFTEELEEENRRLKEVVAEQKLDLQARPRLRSRL